MQDLYAVVSRERRLHSQVHAAVWDAVVAMQRWSSGVAQYMAQVSEDTNRLLDQNSQMIAGLAGPDAPGIKYTPVPAPLLINLDELTAPEEVQQLLAQQYFGATVKVTAWEQQAAATGLRTQAALNGENISADSSVEGDGRLTMQSTASQDGSKRKFGVTPLVLGKAPSNLRSLLAANSINSPGGITLQSRTPGSSTSGRTLMSSTGLSFASRSNSFMAGTPTAWPGEGPTSGSGRSSSPAPTGPRGFWPGLANSRILPANGSATHSSGGSWDPRVSASGISVHGRQGLDFEGLQRTRSRTALQGPVQQPMQETVEMADESQQVEEPGKGQPGDDGALPVPQRLPTVSLVQQHNRVHPI